MESFDKKKYKVLAVEENSEKLKEILSVTRKIKQVETIGINDTTQMVSALKNDHTYDVLLVKYDECEIASLIKQIRMYNTSIFVLLLIDADTEEPTYEMLSRYNIQGYCLVDKGYEEVKMWIHSAVRMLEQTKMLKQLYMQTKKQAETIKDLNAKIEENYYDTVDTLRKAVDKKDPYTRGHSDRVGYIAALIARELGMSDYEVENIKVGGFFHDIGKIGIKDAILTKPTFLTDEEYNEIKNHPVVGYELLEGNDIFEDVLPIIRNHHERYDGNGYPDKLKGEEIPLEARIVAIADSFDAMMSKRSYRDKLELDMTIEEIEKNKGKQFDPEIADVFIKLLKNKYPEITKIAGEY